jgi:endoglucanase
LPVTEVSASASQDPNLPENTRDGDLDTRWSAEGVGQWISFDLGSSYTVEALQLAWYLGNTRRSFFSVQTSLDGVAWSAVLATASSSGTTTDLETVDIPETLARFVRIVGGGNSVNAWNSLCEARILGHAGVLSLPIAQASASSSQDPNLPANAIDGDLDTRWSAEGVGQWISFDLGSLALVEQLELAWYQGNTRRAFFSVQVSTDGSTWTTILLDAASSGTTAGFEAVAIPSTMTRFLRILGAGNSKNAWNSLSEARLLGLPAGAG